MGASSRKYYLTKRIEKRKKCSDKFCENEYLLEKYQNEINFFKKLKISMSQKNTFGKTLRREQANHRLSSHSVKAV